MADHYIQSEDPAIKALLLGEMPPPEEDRQLNHIILGQPMRAFYAAKKAIFLKAVVAYAKVFGKAVNKQQTDDQMTHVIIEIFERFLGWNQEARQDFFEAVAIIVPAETSHDRFYRDRMQVILELIILYILVGKWPTRGLNSPDSKFWKEEQPYGGQHTIIARLALYGEEIMEMIRRPKDENDEPYKVPGWWSEKLSESK